MENWKFPALLVLVLMIATPLVDMALFGAFTALSYIVVGLCAVAIVGLVGVALYNTFWKE